MEQSGERQDRKQRGRTEACPCRKKGCQTLEEQLQSKLDLPGRTEVSCRKARGLNLPERRARGVQHEIAEVRIDEDVKHLGPELQIKSLGQLGVFGHREIGMAS